MSYLQIEGLSFGYPKSNKLLISDFHMEMQQGEIVALLGDSGSGKSTILRLICGLEQPKTGKIILDDTVLYHEKTNIAAERRNVGMIFQDYALFPHLSVLKNVQFGIAKGTQKEKREQAMHLLKLVKMEEHAHKPPHQCSGGQQQRVAIARAMATSPKLLLLDEPFSNLDASLRQTVRQEVKEIIKASGMSAILVTHDKEDVSAAADRFVTVGQTAAIDNR